MIERGVIKHRARAAQLRTYQGLRYGAATPTDIDTYFEVDNNAFIFVELKYMDASVDYGQRLALARLVDTLQAGGAEAIALIAEHNTHDCAADIPAADAIVREYRRGGEWRLLKKRYTVKDVFDLFLWKYAPGGMRRLTGATALQDARHATNGVTADTLPGNETATPSRAIQADTPQREGGETL